MFAPPLFGRPRLGKRVQHPVGELGRREHLVVGEVRDAGQNIRVAAAKRKAGLTVHTASSKPLSERRARKLTHRHRRIGLDRREDLVLAEMGEERAFLTERRHLSKSIKAEVAPLELALAEVAPLGEGDGLAVMRAHRQRVTVDEVLRQDVESGAIEVIRLIQIQIARRRSPACSRGTRRCCPPGAQSRRCTSARAARSAAARSRTCRT